MEIEDAGDLIYFTYYMMDWHKVSQTPTGARCVTCDQEMFKVEVRDRKGLEFEGSICHHCKTILWVRKG